MVRAFYAWLLDNQLTPYIMVDVTVNEVMVPMDLVSNGQIILNIAPCAITNLAFGSEKIQFYARFCGIPRQVIIPIAAVLAIYSYETGIGTIFEPEVSDTQYSTNSKVGIYDKIPESIMSVIEKDHPDDTDDNCHDYNPVTSTRGVRTTLRIVK